ncbi:hypothetical protein Lalb_Chr19g0138551 [Lupinus albus]|uniref:Uncharacterized protein n=1 Tax=Lupinus albus TaxID=3870 RepID=A0A6A4NMI5_LUPAL|nr:hypothetical protein Lalb_Chr19g0138551 [Lupinus albus]
MNCRHLIWWLASPSSSPEETWVLIPSGGDKRSSNRVLPYLQRRVVLPIDKVATGSLRQ